MVERLLQRPPLAHLVAGRRRSIAEVARDRTTKLGQWELVEMLAAGAASNVYRARLVHAAGSSAAYAVKVLDEKLDDDDPRITMLRREAVVGRIVNSAHVVPVLAASVNEPPYYLVMPCLEGRTLADWLTAGYRPAALVALWIARQLAEGLADMYRGGWMHGDVSSQNVFLSPRGHVTLLDLGLARRPSESANRWRGALLGTPHYMAPELFLSADRGDIRSDLYSVGVILFELIAGRKPFAGRTTADLAEHHLRAHAPDLRSMVPNVPQELARLVRQLLAKEPLRRTQSPDELIDRLVELEIELFDER